MQRHDREEDVAAHQFQEAGGRTWRTRARAARKRKTRLPKAMTSPVPKVGGSGLPLRR